MAQQRIKSPLLLYQIGVLYARFVPVCTDFTCASCHTVPVAYGWYRGRRANTEQTSPWAILPMPRPPVAQPSLHDLALAKTPPRRRICRHCRTSAPRGSAGTPDLDSVVRPWRLRGTRRPPRTRCRCGAQLNWTRSCYPWDNDHNGGSAYTPGDNANSKERTTLCIWAERKPIMRQMHNGWRLSAIMEIRKKPPLI